jgi:hypothetical protein
MGDHQQPLIIVLDIDGTIIGDVTYEVCEWELLRAYEPKKLKQYRSTLRAHLEAGLLRPHLADFLLKIHASNDHVHFYIYTASDDQWAQFLVPCIEAVTGIKFSRPIFSRKHCAVSPKAVTKSLTDIAPGIFSRLKSKYKKLNSAKALLRNMCIIDNNNVLSDIPHRCVLCPTYSWSSPYDLTKTLDERILAKETENITRLLHSYQLLPRVLTNSNQFLSDYYSALGRAYKSTSPNSFVKDEMWLHVASLLMTSIKRYGHGKDMTSVVKYINQRL